MEPWARDTLASGDCWARAERDHDRRLGQGWRLLGIAACWRFAGRLGRRGGGSGLGVQLGEELICGGRAGSFAAPHNPAAEVVDDQREVLVLALPGDLVDPDVDQAVEPVGIDLLIADPLDDPPDRVPIDPQHPLERRLVDLAREPRDQALEIPGELRWPSTF